MCQVQGKARGGRGSSCRTINREERGNAKLEATFARGEQRWRWLTGAVAGGGQRTVRQTALIPQSFVNETPKWLIASITFGKSWPIVNIEEENACLTHIMTHISWFEQRNPCVTHVIATIVLSIRWRGVNHSWNDESNPWRFCLYKNIWSNNKCANQNG